MSTLLGDTLNIGSCGLLKNGAQAWVQIEAPETLETNGVAYRPHLLAVSSLNGTLATCYRRSIQVVVCDNTLSIALGEKTGELFRIKHTKNSDLRIADARQAIGIIEQAADDFAAEVEMLCSVPVTDKQWQAFLKEFTPIPENEGRGKTLAMDKHNVMNALWRNDNRVAPWKNTAFGVLQAANTYAHHHMNVRGATRAERNTERMVEGKVDALDREIMTMLNKALVTV